MKKRFVVLVLALLLIFALPSSAYQITGYEFHTKAAMLISMDTGDVLYALNENERMYPASITKLMTAIVMVENIKDLDTEYVTYSKDAQDLILGSGSVVYAGNGLVIGEKMRARDALASLLIASDGDVCYAIAEYVGGTIGEFVDMMNAKAEEMGLKNTHFMNPVGLHDDNHYTTASDIYVFAKYAFDIPEIKEMASKATYKMESTGIHAERTISNSNMMLNPNSSVYYKPTVCGKTGFTDEAGRCLVSVASDSGYNYMAIVLNSETIKGARNEFIDSANMYRWAFRNFEYKVVLGDSTPIDEMTVNLSSETDFVPVTIENGLEALLPKEANSSTISFKTHFNSESIDAPVAKGQLLGTADVYYAEEKIGTVNLIAANDVKVNVFLKFMRDFKEITSKFFTSPFMIVVYFLLGAAIIGFVSYTVYLNTTKKKRRKVRYMPMEKDDYRD